MRFIGLLLALMMMLLEGCVSQINYADGIRSFQIQNYRQAFIHLMPAANAGNPDAQYAIGYMYYYGQGVLEDRKKAWYWINCAAKAGQPDAVAAIRILAPPASK